MDFLKSAGHDILRVPPGIEDNRIAKLAKDAERIILTHDSHFSDILMYPPEEFHGIIRIKIHPPTLADIVNALEDLLSKFSQKDFDKKLVILEKEGFLFR